MNKRVLISMMVGALALTTRIEAQAQSPYFNAVTNLGPVAYWPLNETTQPPAGQYIATNSGSVGTAGNGYYGSWYGVYTNSFYATNHIQRVAGPNVASDTALQCANLTSLGQYVVIPQNTNGLHNAAITITAPFSVEGWILTSNVATSGTATSTRGLVCEGHNSIQNGAAQNYTNSLYGFTLSQYHNYFTFQTYNGKQLANATDIEINNLMANTWYYVVATYDGTTERIYSNSVLIASANYVFAPDKVSPLLIGTSTEPTSEDGSLNFGGNIDDVAIYNQALSQTQINTHYAAVGASYAATVQGDNPTFFFRLNEPAFAQSSYPSRSTYPVATNYGTLGSAANAAYMPGTAPGVAGPPYGGFGSYSNAVAINGVFGAVDVGGGLLPAQLNPTGTQPQTVVSWFQCNPADARFQGIVAHGNSSWRLALDGQNNPNSSAGSSADYDVEFNPGNNPEIGVSNLTTEVNGGFLVNDGNWHMAAGVSDGTNAYLYIDGRLAVQTGGVGSLAGSGLDAMLGGNPSQTIPNYDAAPNIEYFDGQIAQVAYFTNWLTASNILQLYNAAGIPLTIAAQPQSVTNAAGTSASISAVVSGSLPVYQWYSTNVNTSVVAPVTGQTNASLVFNPVNLGNGGYYFVVATNLYNSVTSSVALLTVVGPPILLQQTPTNVDVFAGTTPSLNVTIFGPTPLTYLWFSNSVRIVGASATNYTPNTSVVGANVYTCIVTNTFGAVTNAPITVTVLADPSAPYPVQVLADHPLAYYRLDESSGATAYDYAGGNNAVYTNAYYGVPGYDSLAAVQSDPSETAIGFGFISPPNNFAGNVPTYLNFGTPNGSNAELSVEAWVTQYQYLNGGNGIVTLGWGNGGEQFNLDTGNTASGYLRFSVRNAAGTSYGAGSTKSINNDGLWHHVVGVCDEVNGHVYLYMDGALLASNSIPAGSGLLASTTPLSIGARQSGNFSGTNYDFQFYGSVDDVAIYNYALSSTQVQTHYAQSGIPPQITQVQPSTVTTNASANVSFTVTASGTAPLAYQWLDYANNPIPWGTNATLILTNVQTGQAGTYTVNVTDFYGGPVSTNVHLTVTQVPQIVTDITPSNLTAYATSPATLSVSVSGTPPLYYQWYLNSAPIANATNSTYSFPVLSGTNYYYLAVTNAYNVGSPLVSGTATVVGMPATLLTPTNYTDNLKITFTGYNRSETLSDFPVLVRLSTNVPGFNYNHFADPSGGDLRFTDAGGVRVLPSEIDQWNPNGESTVWVQVPALSGTNTAIWAYWGNPAATTPPPGTNVWVPQPWENLPSFDVVYHLKESAFPFIDSAGQFTSTTGIAPTPVAGIVGSAESFTASPYLDAGPINVGNAFTLSAWVNVAMNANSVQAIWATKGGSSSNGFAFFVNTYPTADESLIFETANGSSSPTLTTGAGAVTSNQWHFVTAVVNRAASAAQLYVDGVLHSSTGSIRPDFATNEEVYLGQFAGSAFPFNGLIDEARIRGATNSANWVWASYMTVAQNSSFQSNSAVTTTVPPLPIANPDYYTILENTTNTFAVTANDLVQAPGGYLTVINVNPTNGVANIQSGTNVVFTPTLNFTGKATIGYTITDNVGNTNTGLATVTVVSSTPVAISAQYSGGNLAISGTGGLALGTYYVVGTTNLTTPMASWPVVSTNQFDTNGDFSITVPIATTNQAQFFRVKQ
ncbi:MAG TPA: DUF2341 domain-containing protein [Candidatus Sulfotelmatobacter sp.]|nr:DUF2341 domain-containing protein [Candidatus Sulfotelmatobacter sp.]